MAITGNGNDIRELTDNGLAETAGLISRREYNLSIVRARQTAEFLIKNYASEKNIPYTTLADTIEALYAQNVINRTSRDAFHNIRLYGNKAVHDGDNDPENAQKAYYLLKSEVSTFLSRKTVSVDRTPVRVGGLSDGRMQPENVEVEIESESGTGSRRSSGSQAYSTDNGNDDYAGSGRRVRNSRERRVYSSGEEASGARSGSGSRSYDNAAYGRSTAGYSSSGQASSEELSDEEQALMRDIRRRINGGRDPEEDDRDTASDTRRRNRQSDGRRRSDADRRSGSGSRSSDGGRNSSRSAGRNQSRNGRNSSDRNGRQSAGNGRNGRKSAQESRFTIYDLLRILIPIFVIILLIIIIRTITASQKPVETTTAAVETSIEETTTMPETTMPETTTEPETTEAPDYDYRTNTDGVNIRYADNQNRIYTQLPANTNIGKVTPIDGSDFVAFTLDGVDVVVNKNFIEPIE